MYICQNIELFQFQHFNYTKNKPQKMHQHMKKTSCLKSSALKLDSAYTMSEVILDSYFLITWYSYIYPRVQMMFIKRMKKFPRFLFWNSSSSLSGLNTRLKMHCKRFESTWMITMKIVHGILCDFQILERNMFPVHFSE